MKKFTLILFAFSLLLNAGFAQRLNPGQKETVNNQKAQEMIPGLKMACSLNETRLLPVYINASSQFLKSTYTVKLDSIITSNYWNYSTKGELGPNSSVEKEVYNYDGNFRLQQITQSSWDSYNKDYKVTNEKVIFYNSAGLVDSAYITDVAYSQMYSNKYIYDSKERLNIIYLYEYSNSKWSPDIKIEYSYNNFDQLTELTQYMLENNIYSPINVFQFSYDISGNLEGYKWINKVGNIGEQAIYEWESDGKLKSVFYEDLFWGGKYNTVCYYNSSGDKIKHNTYCLEDSAWKLSNYAEYFYTDLNFADLLPMQNPPSNVLEAINCQLPRNNSNGLTKKINQYILWEDLKVRTVYYYSPLEKESPITGITNIQDSDFSVYPNPATHQVIFTWENADDQLNLKIYQLTGICVMDKKIKSKEIVKLDKLTSGIYLYKLADKQNVLKSGKFVIE